MKKFMDNDFLLSCETAQHLFTNYANKMPIVDYHCHVSPMEIAQDRRFENIAQLWLGGDHYKWRLMRSAGVSEQFITGDASDKDKFIKWAEVLGKAIGNPLYHWSHLELKRFFGYDGALNADTAEAVYELCNERLKDADMTVRGLIKQSNVTHICTTDDPTDTLEWHRQIAADADFCCKVFPTWRPDKAMNLEKTDYRQYIGKLCEASGICIETFADLKRALCARMDAFAAAGCHSADHGLEYVYFSPANEGEVEEIFASRLKNAPLSAEQIVRFKTAFMLFLGGEYHKRAWTMQIHYGCKRDNNVKMFRAVGTDAGFDCINNYTPAATLADFLNALEEKSGLPKTIIYSLNPSDNQAIDSIVGCFQDDTAAGKIQHGSAWWFNDHKAGIVEQLVSLANQGNLGGFIGMLTDSRSFLSYARHEYFRRILCDLIGTWVSNGEVANDEKMLGAIVSDISYNNAINYFGFQ